MNMQQLMEILHLGDKDKYLIEWIVNQLSERDERITRLENRLSISTK